MIGATAFLFLVSTRKEPRICNAAAWHALSTLLLLLLLEFVPRCFLLFVPLLLRNARRGFEAVVRAHPVDDTPLGHWGLLAHTLQFVRNT
eukprot:scaffold66387_cov17-Tisochrysis_lutea.AAC.1